jgi:hypothetical protein
MDEAELQARILIALFRIRTNGDGRMPLDIMVASGGAPVTLGEIAASARYLADKRFINFTSAAPGNVSMAGTGQIASLGVDYVKSRMTGEIPTLAEMLAPIFIQPPPPEPRDGLIVGAGTFDATEPYGRLTGVEMKAVSGSFVPPPPPPIGVLATGEVGDLRPPPRPPLEGNQPPPRPPNQQPPTGWMNSDDGSAARAQFAQRAKFNPALFTGGTQFPLNPDGRDIWASVVVESAKVDPTTSHEQILRRIEAIELALANAPPISPGIGHNNPPEPILTAEDVSNLREIFQTLRDTPATPAPSPAGVKHWEEALEQSSQKILAYLAKLGDKFVSGAATKGGTIAITVLLGGGGVAAAAWPAISFYNDLAEKLADLATLLHTWSGALH